MLDDAVAVVLDSRRPEPQQSPALAAARGAALLRGVAALEQDLERLSGRLDLAAIAAACALGYLDFRLPGLEWRNRHPAVAAWFTDFARRPSMEQTRPPAV
jgi:glutathione S-transferase